MPLRQTSLTPFAQRLLALFLAVIVASCSPIRSDIIIKAGEEFLLGGNRPSAYSVELTNRGTVSIQVTAEGRQASERRRLATLDPGQELSHRFAEGEAAVLTNLGNSDATIAAVIYTASGLNMGYRQAPSAYKPTLLTAKQASEDVHILRRALEEIHPGYGRYTDSEAMEVRFSALAGTSEEGTSEEGTSEEGTTDMVFYRDISRLLAEIRCDHTKAELPEAIEAYRKKAPTYLPFTFRLFGDHMYIDRPGTSGFARGDEIARINGQAVSKVVEDIAAFVPVDGYTDAAKRAEMEDSNEFLGDAIDHFWPFLYGWPTEWRIETRPSIGEEAVRVALDPLTYGAWLELASGGSGRYIDFPDSVDFRMLDESTGYLSIGTFVNYRSPVDPSTVFDPIFDQLTESGADNLIIDLRACGGGSDDVPAALTEYLSDTTIPKFKRSPWVRTVDVGDLRPYLSSWDSSVFQMPAFMFRDLDNGCFELRQPVGKRRPAPERENRFRGALTVLSSPTNASGATMLIALLQEHYGARIIGEPTGGSVEGPTAGVIFFLELPNSGIVVRVPAMRSWVNVDKPRAGYGVTPNVLVEPTVDDWLHDRDVVLKAARKR